MVAKFKLGILAIALISIVLIAGCTGNRQASEITKPNVTFKVNDETFPTVTGKVLYVLVDKNITTAQLEELNKYLLSANSDYTEKGRGLKISYFNDERCANRGVWKDPTISDELFNKCYFADYVHVITGKEEWLMKNVVEVTATKEITSVEQPPAEEPAKIYTFNEVVQVGDFEYTFHGWETYKHFGSGYTPTFPEKGQFLEISLTIKNIANTKKTWLASDVSVVDSNGYEYVTSGKGMLAGNNALFIESINSGLMQSGNLIYDIPLSTNLKDYYILVTADDQSKKVKFPCRDAPRWRVSESLPTYTQTGTQNVTCTWDVY